MKVSQKVLAGAVAASLCLGLVALSGCSGGSGSSSSAASSASSNASSTASQAAAAGTRQFSDDELLSGKHNVVMQVEGYDPITIELDADAADRKSVV